MREQQNQMIPCQLQEYAKSQYIVSSSISAFFDYMRLLHSTSRYLQQYYKNYMRLRDHVQIPIQKEKRVIKKLRTRKDLKAINRSAENRRKMNKVIYGLKLKPEYIIPGRRDSVNFMNGSSFEIRSK